MFKKQHLFYCMLVVLVSATLVACQSKINSENFSKVQYEMTPQQVYAILGQPSNSSSINIAGLSGTIATWENAKTHTKITIQFFNQQVKIKNLSVGQGP